VSGSGHPEATVRSKVGTRRGIAPIWLIPIATVLVAAYLVWHEFNARGPLIEVTFRTAEGLTAGQSQLRFRDVNVGKVETIGLTPDHEKVLIGIRMNKAETDLLTKDAQFWVVKPRFFAGNVTGLDTLISGSYIQVQPGKDTAATAYRFAGLEDPPVRQFDERGQTVQFRTPRLGSLSIGSPVFFRDIQVGQVVSWDLSNMAEYVTVQAFIGEPYDKYVTGRSRFWNASGLSVKLGADGVQVQMESLRAVVLGGVAFDNPPASKDDPLPPVAANQVFTLYEDRDAADRTLLKRRVPMISYFEDSISGLTVGAPVVFQGIRVGQVTAFDLEWNENDNKMRLPVRYEIEPERIAFSAAVLTRGPLENARILVHDGMRARLATANLLTGQQQISLDIIPDAEPADVSMHGDAIVIPSAPGALAGIMDSVNKVLAKVDQIPLAQIGRNLNNSLAGADQLIRSPDIKAAIVSLRGALSSVQDLARRIDQAATPALRDLPATMKTVQDALNNANKLIGSVQRGYGDDSQFNRDLDRLIEQLTVATRSVRTLADQLNRNPDALLRGRSTGSP
jgi:paraquat-inducible protein B